jgi:hypothetical protein
MKKFAQVAAMTVMATAGLGLAGLAAATEAGAQPVGPVPDYHWCPGDPWDPAWGPNWDSGTCHDDHHRDIDGDDTSRDFFWPAEPGFGEIGHRRIPWFDGTTEDLATGTLDLADLATTGRRDPTKANADPRSVALSDEVYAGTGALTPGRHAER